MLSCRPCSSRLPPPLLLVAFVLPAAAAEDAPLPSRVQFNRHIRPILSESCFRCHGPDRRRRKARLRLDRKEGFSKKLEDSRVVVPGEPSRSELVRRIRSEDADEIMPPADSGKKLTARQKALLVAWVRQGAKWQGHWSFAPAVRPELPTTVDGSRMRNPIDPFVLARLTEEGLEPSPEADRTTLIRRLSFDLTGLPPSLEEIDAFLADETASAYERVVDRLLASGRYGERMAMEWLDAARYADSHGYSLDRRRVMWPWRDWVIRAYNDNLPFDRFTIEQLAGDLLPQATTAQRVATGFNRNHPIQSEGGVINEEYRVETVVDRVETTSAVFLGMTFGCARCHDHKYEQISQREFYEFYAFFNNVPETAHVGNSDRQADTPFIKAPSVLQEDRARELREEISRLERRVEAQKAVAEPFEAVERVWIDDEIPPGSRSLGNGSGAQSFEFVSKPDHPVFSGERSSRRTSKGRGQHLIQDADPALAVGAGARLFTQVFVDPEDPPRELMLQWHDGKGWEHRAFWGGNHIGWGQDGTSSRKPMGALPKAGEWVRLEVAASDVGLGPGSRITGWAFTQFDGTVYWDRAGIVERQRSAAALRLQELKAELASLTGSPPTVMVMSELSPPRRTFVLTRGQYDRPSDAEVTPALPALLGKLPAAPRANRLTLARWIVGPSNPLTARVVVNRLWQMHFGTGIVKTSEDFGSQGEWPTHPSLLDWLATEFVRTGWNVKALQKLIVMSATYRQSSNVTPRHLEVDPENRLLARGPRFRLPAEMIRDQALEVSGLLVERLGGESVKPYQPPGLWDDVVYSNVPRFAQDHGDKLYRRSLYTYWKRSVPPPNLQAFDAPSREVCVLTRSRTNTPLAALVLMNDPTFVEAARKMAERCLTGSSEKTAERLAFLFRLATGRPPRQREIRWLDEALTDLLTGYRQDPAAAAKLIGVGESRHDATLDVVELAAYAAVANALLGTDEAITRN